jgi:hypothetical protein
MRRLRLAGQCSRRLRRYVMMMSWDWAIVSLLRQLPPTSRGLLLRRLNSTDLFYPGGPSTRITLDRAALK